MLRAMQADPMPHLVVERLRRREVDHRRTMHFGKARRERNRMICLARARAAQNEMTFRHYVRPLE